MFGFLFGQKRKTVVKRRNTQILVSHQIKPQIAAVQTSITDELEIFKQQYFKEHAEYSVDQIRAQFVKRHDNAPPTQLLPAVNYTIHSPLPVDSNGRAYMGTKTYTNIETLTLTGHLIKRFFSYMGEYPAIIYLSPQRWIYCEHLEHFRTADGVRIPFALGGDNYDVCVKGNPLQG